MKATRTRWAAAACLAATALAASPAAAQTVGRRIPYHASLAPPWPASVELVLRIYDDPVSELPEAVLWGAEVHDVAPDDRGNLLVLVGDSDIDLDQNGRADLDELDPSRPWYLDVSVGDGGSLVTLRPRQRIFPAHHAVTADGVLDGSITAPKLAAGAVTSDELAPGSISGAKIVDGTLSAAQIATATLTTVEIADLALTERELATNAVRSEQIADGSVGTAELRTAAVNATDIANGAVDTARIANGAVTRDKLDLSTTRTPERTLAGGSFFDPPLELGAYRYCALTVIQMHENSCPSGTSCLSPRCGLQRSGGVWSLYSWNGDDGPSFCGAVCF